MWGVRGRITGTADSNLTFKGHMSKLGDKAEARLTDLITASDTSRSGVVEPRANRQAKRLSTLRNVLDPPRKVLQALQPSH